MKNGSNRFVTLFSPTDNWLRFTIILMVYVICKGVVYLAVMPPFEAWDEYQHVGFIKYLEDHDERPVLNRSFIARDLLEQIVAYPVPDAMLDQIASTGAVGYQDYFTALPAVPEYLPEHEEVRLYQAQHGVVYYRLASFLSSPLAFSERLLDKVFTLRAINLAFTVFSFVLILWFLSRTHENRVSAAAIALLICSQPILVLNGARVANDSLAIATGTLAIVIGLTPQLRVKLVYALLAGAAIGISCWAKSISAVLFPFWFCCLFIAWIDEEISLNRMLLLCSVAFISALAILANYFLFNFQNYGSLFAMQESIVNHDRNRGLFDILTAAPPLTLLNDLLLKWGEESIWSGGWSFLRVRDVRNIVKVVMIACLLGWAFRLIPAAKKEAVSPSPQRVALLSLCLVTLTSLALSWHYLQSALAWGHATTNAWYICISLPFFLIFIANGAYQWSPRFGFGAVGILSLVYIYADFRGMITMIHYYSGEASGIQALQRLASIHPAWLGTPVLLTAVFIMLAAAVLSLAIVFTVTYAALKRTT